MAKRLLRSHKPADLSGSDTDDECELTPHNQLEQVSQEVTGENLEGNTLEQEVEVITNLELPNTSAKVDSQVPSSNLLNLIWETMQNNRRIDEQNRKKEKEEERKIHEQNRLATERKIEEAGRITEEKLDKLKADLVKSVELVTEQFKTEINKQISLVDARVERIANSITENVTSLQRSSQQQIAELSQRVSEVEECLHARMSEQSNELHKDLENKTGEISTSLQKLLQTAENVNQSKLSEINTKLNELQDQMAEANTLPRVNPSEPHATEGLSQGNVEASFSIQLDRHVSNDSVSEVICDNVNLDGTNKPVVREVNNVNHVTNKICHRRNESVSVPMSLHGGVLGDIQLPKFEDANKQNVVQFIRELDSYFRVKGVDEILKLPLAAKSLKDSYCRSWLETVYTELKDYNEFCKGLIELLWGNQEQTRVRCSIYQDKYNRNSGQTISGHFLSYALKGSYLSPRMTDLDIIHAISSHYPSYIRRSLLSANITTVQEALTFLRQLEAFEQADPQEKNNHHSQHGETNSERGRERSNQSNHVGNRDQRHVRNVEVQRGRYTNQRRPFQNDRRPYNVRREPNETFYSNDQGHRGGRQNALNPQASPYNQGASTSQDVRRDNPSNTNRSN